MTQTELGQVFKLPVLVHHYLEHQEMDNEMSLADFLSQHYSGDIQHPDDIHGDHAQLPFKTVDVHQGLTLSVPTVFEYECNSSSFTASTLKLPLYKMLQSEDAGDSIWQPPCIA
jgi:hypothetical protein